MSFLVDRHKKQRLAMTFTSADLLKFGLAKPEKPCGFRLSNLLARPVGAWQTLQDSGSGTKERVRRRFHTSSHTVPSARDCTRTSAAESRCERRSA